MKYKAKVILIVVLLVAGAIIIGYIYSNIFNTHDPVEQTVAVSPSLNQTVIETQSAVVADPPEEDFIFDELNPDYRQAMRQWVITVSEISKLRNPDFIIIPQNCSPLLTFSGEVDGELCLSFIDAIDGL